MPPLDLLDRLGESSPKRLELEPSRPLMLNILLFSLKSSQNLFNIQYLRDHRVQSIFQAEHQENTADLTEASRLMLPALVTSKPESSASSFDFLVVRLLKLIFLESPEAEDLIEALELRLSESDAWDLTELLLMDAWETTEFLLDVA